MESSNVRFIRTLYRYGALTHPLKAAPTFLRRKPATVTSMPASEGSIQTQRQSTATFAVTVFIGSAVFLHWRYAGMASLLTFKALGFFVVGILVAAFALGLAFYGMQRSLMGWLARFATDPPSPTYLSLAKALGTGLLALEVVAGYLLTRAAFFWMYV